MMCRKKDLFHTRAELKRLGVNDSEMEMVVKYKDVEYLTACLENCLILFDKIYYGTTYYSTDKERIANRTALEGAEYIRKLEKPSVPPNETGE